MRTVALWSHHGMTRTILAGMTLSLVLWGCENSQRSAIEDSIPPPTKKLSDLKQKGSDKSPEELAELRKKAGFKSTDEIMAENAAGFEKGAREYIKTRIKEYRAFVKDLRGMLDSLEKGAPGWPKAKDPDKAFAKFNDKYKADKEELTKRYDTLTAKGAEGGNTQAILGKAFRTWEDLVGDLGPKIGEDARFATTLGEIRATLDKVDAALDDIDKDEGLEKNKFYEGKGDAKAEGDAKADAKGGAGKDKKTG